MSGVRELKRTGDWQPLAVRLADGRLVTISRAVKRGDVFGARGRVFRALRDLSRAFAYPILVRRPTGYLPCGVKRRLP